jgi:cytochrome c biogenesis factor
MDEELKRFLQSKAKATQYGGYSFILESIHFTVIENIIGISMQYYYRGERGALEPIELSLNKNITLMDFSKKLVEIIESIKK